MSQAHKVGSYLIDSVCIYQITSVTSDGMSGGRLLHYQPFTGSDKRFTATIPEQNLSRACLRPLQTKTEIDQFLADLTSYQLDSEKYQYDPRQIKEDLYQNIPAKLIGHLKYFYSREESLPKIDQNFKAEMFSHLCLEISFVTHSTPQAAKKSLENCFS